MQGIENNKKCSRCGQVKPLDGFHRNTLNKDGRHAYCKVCHVRSNLEYRTANRPKVRDYMRRHRIELRRTPRGFLSCVYNLMQHRVQGRDATQRKSYAGLAILDRDAFYAWAIRHPVFLSLHEYWLTHGQKRRDIPSINRIDPTKGYTLDNINWLTQSQNSSMTRRNKRFKLPGDKCPIASILKSAA